MFDLHNGRPPHKELQIPTARRSQTSKAKECGSSLTYPGHSSSWSLAFSAQTKVEIDQKSANTRPAFIVLSRKMKIFPWHSRYKGVESDLGNSQLAETIHFPSSTGAARGKGGSEYLYRRTCHEEVSRHRRPIR